MPPQPRRPTSTYRLQLHAGFTLDDAAALADYLAALGVSHAYASPYLQAAAGSTHGYDAVDHSRVNRELGGSDAHARFCRALGEAGLGQVLDVVPNHMAITGRENAAWWDVLEQGAASPYAGYFDIDWDAPEAKLRNKVLLPILGDHYGRALEAGELRIARDEKAEGGFVLRYYDHEAPVSLGSLRGVLLSAAEPAGSDELATIAEAACLFSPSPTAPGRRGWRGAAEPGEGASGGEGSNDAYEATDGNAAAPQARGESSGLGSGGTLTRHCSAMPTSPSGGGGRGDGPRHLAVLKSQLARLCRDDRAVPRAIDAALDRVNADPDALDAVLRRQCYRLAHWRTASRELNYRRFFDVSTLIGVRIEEEDVFAATHRLILGWLSEGVFDGLRIDHPDGLRDPKAYFDRLRDAAPQAWIVVEKILESGSEPEWLPEDWPVAGTTGYDFLNRVNGLFVDPAGERPLTELYTELTGESTNFRELVREKKHLVLRDLFGGEINRLTSIFAAVCEATRRFRDFARSDIEQVLRETIACFPVYRTYIRPEAGVAGISVEDARRIEDAVEQGKRHRPDLDPELFDFLRDVLLLRQTTAAAAPHGGATAGEGLPAAADLIARFQQLTGPAMAKGVEDTAFYNFNRLVSLNEVGGDPSHFGVGVDDFHRQSAHVQRRWPATMLALTTHDTKRSEDVRARLNLLSEIAQRWGDAVRRWMAMNDRHRRGGMPDRNAEYLLYQTLVGAWPIDADRAARYMEKASREAKAQTSWIKPHRAYDEALEAFVRGVLAHDAFTGDLAAFVAPLVEPGRINSLSQKLLELASPGVPDTYQGTELWDLSLVDPDNRRPVDFALRRRLLSEVERMAPEEAWRRADEGLPKLLLVQRALRLRRERPELFGLDAGYSPLQAQGAKAAHAVAFMRGDAIAVVAPRLVIGLAGDWGDTTVTLPPHRWRNVLTGDEIAGGEVRLAEALRRFPVGLWVRA